MLPLFALLPWLSRRKWHGALVASIAVLSCVFVSVAVLIPSFFTVTVAGEHPVVTIDADERPVRFHMAADGIRAIENNPLLGTGLGALPSPRPGYGAARPHVTAIDVAASSGLLALCALGVFLAAGWRGRRRPTAVGLWTGVVALAIDSLRHDITHFRHAWIALGFAVAAVASARDVRRRRGSTS